MMNKLVVFLSLSFALSACSAEIEKLPYYNSADFTPIWLEESDWKREDLHQIPAFSFLDQNGERITEKSFEGKIYVASFFFTICPGICPQLNRNLMLVQQHFLDDQEIMLLSHTVMPRVDSIPRLHAYADDFGIVSTKWRLVTGEQEDIYRIGRQSYFAELEAGLSKTADDFLHTENFILVDRERHIRGVYNGTLPLDTQRLIADIEVLKQE